MTMELLGYRLKNKENQMEKDIVFATELVKDLILGKLDLPNFLLQYNNFYYWFGFDELSESEQSKLSIYAKILNIHKEIQINVLDRIYIGNLNADKLHLLNRISMNEGIQAINAIFQVNKLEFQKVIGKKE